MCSAMLSRTHRDSDDLFHDLVEFERINLARIERNKDTKKICRNDDPVTEPKGNNQVNTEAKPQGRLPERRPGDNKPLCFKCRKYGHVAKYCTNGKIICYTCKKEAHISKNCPGETKENLAIGNLAGDVDQNAKYFKEARINRHMVRGYIDPGSKVVTIRKSDAEIVRLKWENMKETFYLTGYGAGKVMPLGESTIDLEVDHAKAVVVVLVVPDEIQTVPVLIGQPFTEQQHITMVKRKDTLTIFEEDKLKNVDKEKKCDFEMPTAVLPEIDLWPNENIIPSNYIGFVIKADTVMGQCQIGTNVDASNVDYLKI
ncbi:hypothetical protein Trydic_g8342 [Trypoxylus dichotomus]